MLIAQLYIITLIKSSDYSAATYALLPEAEKAAIRTHDLGIISAPYIGLGAFIIVMLILIALVKIPQKDHHEAISVKNSFRILFSNRRYYEGVIAQMFYVGVQIMCWTFIFQYVDNLNASRPADQQLTATWFNMAAMISFFFGRAASTTIMKYVQPARLMFIFALCGMALISGTIFIVGIGGLLCLVGTSITMSLMFPTIYGIALRDMGDEAKLGSAGLVMAIVGGALMPPLQGRILDIGGGGFSDKLFFGYVPEVNISFILPFICLCVIAIYSYRSIKIHLKV
jgi:FHS family L-fucose permease-like MFS transporter